MTAINTALSDARALQATTGGPVAVILPSHGVGGAVGSAYYVNDTIRLESGDHLIGAGRAVSCLRATSGANLDAVIASANWVDNTAGLPFSNAYGIIVENLAVDGNFLNNSTGAILQTAGAGHGIAIAGYRCEVRNCDIRHTRGHGIFFDTTSANGTGLGECIECKVYDCRTTRTGLCGISFEDTAGVSGGVTDWWVVNNNLTYVNIRGSATGEEGHAFFARNGGGGVLLGNHAYQYDYTQSFGASFAGWPPGKCRDGYHVLSAYGMNIDDNQCDGFGYTVKRATDASTTNGSTTITSATIKFHALDAGQPIAGSGIQAGTTIASVTNSTTAVLSLAATATASGVTIDVGTIGTYHGFYVQGKQDRGYVMTNNRIWSNDPHPSNTVYCIRLVTASNEFVGIVVSGNIGISRPNSTPTLRGILMGAAGTGSNNGTMIGNSFPGMVRPFDGGGSQGCANVIFEGNSWQLVTATPTTGYWPKGIWLKNANVTSTTSPGWVCTTGGTPGTWTALPAL